MASVSTPIPIPLASVRGLSKLASDERIINGIPEKTGTGQNERVVLYGRAGLSTWAIAAADAARGMLDFGAELLAVHGTTLFTYSAAGIGTSIGTVSGADPVVMARNAATVPQAVIVCNAGVYVYSGGVLSVLSDPDLPSGSVGVVWMDGYFVFALNNGNFYLSDLNSTAIGGLGFATAESNPDGLVAVARLRQEIYFLGSKTTEVWVNSGTASFPFERLGGATMQVGCASKHTVREVAGTLYWLDTDSNVVRVGDGYTPQIISDRGVYESVRDVADKTEIRALSFSLGNRAFYVLTHATFTWVYDVSTGLWSEWKSRNNQCWRGVTAESFAGKTIIGSRLEGTLWYVDEDSFAEGSDEIEFIARFPRIDTFPKGGTISQLELDMETGVGIATSGVSDTIDPQVSLYWSDDGGKTLKGGLIRSLGQQGNYLDRVRFTRLGSFRQNGRIFEARITSRVFKALLGARILAEPLDLG